MLSNDLKQIVLLNPVKINYDLMKWSKDEDKNTSFGFPLSDSGMSSGGIGMGSDIFPDNANVWDGVPFSVRREFRSPFWRSVVNAYIKFRLLFTKPKKDPVKFFMEVKDNFAELEEQKVPDKKIESMIKALEKSRQKFAISTLVSSKSIIQLENKLVEAGFKQYQTEESLIKFIKSCKKGLCLTEIEYFDRVIPEDVMAKFDQAEMTKCFDNYYILYYDPKKVDNMYYTKAPKPKDPIMFGVIRNSNKLYFIADWIDELCNLTYKDILENGIDYKLKKEKEK